MIRAFTYPIYHGKAEPGSTRLRVRQLQKYWPEYSDYKYGQKPDVMVYQKVYIQPDWRLMEHAPWIQILDICDPDWLEGANITETISYMDGVVCPTESMAEFLRQLTDKPVKVIPDRHEVEGVKLNPNQHRGKLKSAVWFGYQQNAELLKSATATLQRKGIKLTIISNADPYLRDTDYEFKKYDSDTILDDLAKFDVCILPQGDRPIDRFKSNNKTTMAWLAGVPVVTDLDSLEAMETAKARNDKALACYNEAIEKYDVKLSVKEMKDFIEELKR